MRIEIPNWSKYNDRPDVKNASWFRCDREFYTDDIYLDLSTGHRLLWIVLWAMATKGHGVMSIHVDMLVVATGTDRSTVEDGLSTLHDLEKIIIHADDLWKVRNAHGTDTVRARNADVTPALRPRSLHNVTGHNETGRNETEQGTLSPVKTPNAARVPKKGVLQFTEADLAVGREWLEFARTEMPWKAEDPSWTAERFAEAIAKVRLATDLNDLGTKALLEFIKRDDFWAKNAISPAGLLKRGAKNGERKIDNILVRMRTPQDRQYAALMAWAEREDAKENGNT